MKTFPLIKTFMAVALAGLVIGQARGEPATSGSPPVAALPDGVQPDSPVAQVIKLAQAGVDSSVIQTYISNCPTAFNLDADKIIALTDAGLPNDMVNAMFAHDRNYLSSFSSTSSTTSTDTTGQPAPVVASAPPPATVSSAPPADPSEVNVNYFYNTLSPYGAWVDVDGYGRCWRPNIVVYDTSWRPYCDRGRWVYTDCGWYWDSEYSWGVTFHYGRWFNSPRYGWCWWPDTVWAPSWVTWRSCDDYCGWAPLPPYTVYQPGIGFSYRGNHVAIGFDFGLGVNCFTFVSAGNFCQPHPRRYCLAGDQVGQFYNRTVIINNFGSNQRTICNNGVSVTVIGNSSHHPIQAVPVHSMTGGHHGGPTFRYYGTDNSDNSRNRQFAGTDGRFNQPPTAHQSQNVNNSRRYSYSPDATRINPAPNSKFNRSNQDPVNAPDSASPMRSYSSRWEPKPVYPNNRRDGQSLILTGRGNANPAKPATTYPAPAANAPQSSVARHESSWNVASGATTERRAGWAPPTTTATSPTPNRDTMPNNYWNRAPENQRAQSEGRKQIQTFNPQSSSSANFASARSQRTETRLAYSASEARSAAPAYQARPSVNVNVLPSQGQFKNNNYQGWITQNR